MNQTPLAARRNCKNRIGLSLLLLCALLLFQQLSSSMGSLDVGLHPLGSEALYLVFDQRDERADYESRAATH